MSNQSGQQTRVLPLTRSISAKQQMLSMLLYSLVSILTLVWCLSTITSTLEKNMNGLFGWINLFQILVLIYMLVPTTTLLCGALFGSWRGALVSCISIYSSIQITHLLDNHFWLDMSLVSFWFLIPVGIVILLVGLSYDLRKYISRLINVFIHILAALVLLVVLLFIVWGVRTLYDGIGAIISVMLYCTIVFIVPIWVVLTLSVDRIIQKALS